jgi:hypothetical protein
MRPQSTQETKMKQLKIAILMMAMCTFVMAQTKTDAKKPAEKSAAHAHDKAAMPPGGAPEMPKPGPEAQKLYSMVGTWSATIKTEPGPWMPKGGTDKGSMIVKKGPGGFSVVQDFKSNGSFGAFMGHGNIWWDKNAGHYGDLWCDSMAGCTMASTKMESDKKWSTDMNGEMNGKKVHTVINGTMSDDGNSMHEDFMQSFDGSPATKTMSIDYKRVGKAMAEKPATAKE